MDADTTEWFRTDGEGARDGDLGLNRWAGEAFRREFLSRGTLATRWSPTGRTAAETRASNHSCPAAAWPERAARAASADHLDSTSTRHCEHRCEYCESEGQT